MSTTDASTVRGIPRIATAGETRCTRLTGALALFLLLAFAPAASAAAQTPSTGTIAGAVRDSAGAPLEGTQVIVLGTALQATTGPQGNFRFEGVPAGQATVRARRIGFRMTTQSVAVESGQTASVSFALRRLVQELEPVVVEAKRDLRMRQLEGFFTRKHQGIGRFITRDQIDERQTASMPELLRSLIPGVNIIQTRYSMHSVRLRGNRCAPLVVLDGFPAQAAEFDLDAISPTGVMAIEVYSGPATVPAEFRTSLGMDACGVIAIWSGLPDRPPRSKMSTDRAKFLLDSIAIASGTAPRAYTAQEVDIPASVDSNEIAQPAYPDSLYAKGVEGEVVAEFVVDTTGLIVPASFGAVRSSHPLFTAAVRRALLASKFHAAERGGRYVRQVMVLPFRFVLARQEGEQ